MFTDIMDEQKSTHFSVLKKKIIKTDEILHMYGENHNKLKKAQQAYKEIKSKCDQATAEYDRLKLEHERCLFNSETIKAQYENLDKENEMLKQQQLKLQEDYNQQAIQSQLIIRELKNELQMLQELKMTADTMIGKTKRKSGEDRKEKFKEVLEIETKDEEIARLRLKNEALACDLMILNECYSDTSQKNQIEKDQLIKELNTLKSQMSLYESKYSEEMNKHKLAFIQKEKEVYDLQQEVHCLSVFKEKLASIELKNDRLNHQLEDQKVKLTNIKENKNTKDICSQTDVECRTITYNISVQTIDTMKTLYVHELAHSENRKLKQKILDCESEIFKLKAKSKTIKKNCCTQTELLESDNIESVDDILEEMYRTIPRMVSPIHSICNENCNQEAEAILLSTETNNQHVISFNNIPNITITPPSPMVEKSFEQFEENKVEKDILSKTDTEVIHDDNNEMCHTELTNKKDLNTLTHKIKVKTPRNCIKKISNKHKYRRPYINNYFKRVKYLAYPDLRKPYILKNRKVEKEQDHILKALQILKQSNISFTISNESTIPACYRECDWLNTTKFNVNSPVVNATQHSPVVNATQNSPVVNATQRSPVVNATQLEYMHTQKYRRQEYLTENLTCACKNCNNGNSCMLLKETESDPELLGFFSVKKEILTPPSSKMENTIENKTSNSVLLNNKLTSENLLDVLAQLVSEKLEEKNNWSKRKRKKCHLDSYDSLNSETDTELEKLFKKPADNILERNKMLLKKAEMQKELELLSNSNLKSIISNENSRDIYNPSSVNSESTSKNVYNLSDASASVLKENQTVPAESSKTSIEHFSNKNDSFKINCDPIQTPVSPVEVEHCNNQKKQTKSSIKKSAKPSYQKNVKSDISFHENTDIEDSVGLNINEKSCDSFQFSECPELLSPLNSPSKDSGNINSFKNQNKDAAEDEKIIIPLENFKQKNNDHFEGLNISSYPSESPQKYEEIETKCVPTNFPLECFKIVSIDKRQIPNENKQIHYEKETKEKFGIKRKLEETNLDRFLTEIDVHHANKRVENVSLSDCVKLENHSDPKYNTGIINIFALENQEESCGLIENNLLKNEAVSLEENMEFNGNMVDTVKEFQNFEEKCVENVNYETQLNIIKLPTEQTRTNTSIKNTTNEILEFLVKQEDNLDCSRRQSEDIPSCPASPIQESIEKIEHIPKIIPLEKMNGNNTNFDKKCFYSCPASPNPTENSKTDSVISNEVSVINSQERNTNNESMLEGIDNLPNENVKSLPAEVLMSLKRNKKKLKLFQGNVDFGTTNNDDFETLQSNITDTLPEILEPLKRKRGRPRKKQILKPEELKHDSSTEKIVKPNKESVKEYETKIINQKNVNTLKLLTENERLFPILNRTVVEPHEENKSVILERELTPQLETKSTKNISRLLNNIDFDKNKKNVCKQIIEYPVEDEEKANTIAKKNVIRKRKSVSKLHSNILRQMKEKRKMFQSVAEIANSINKVNNCDQKNYITNEVPAATKSTINHQISSVVEKHPLERVNRNNKCNKKIHVVQNILIPPNSSCVVDLLDRKVNTSENFNLDSEKSTIKQITYQAERQLTDEKQVEINKNKFATPTKINEITNEKTDILSAIIKEMNKDKAVDIIKSSTSSTENNLPNSIEDKEWRKGIMVIAETISNTSNEEEYFLEDFSQADKLLSNLKQNTPKKFLMLMERLLNSSTEDNIPEEFVIEFKRLNEDNIAQLILQTVSKDIHDRPDGKTYPAPLMTRTQRILLGLMTCLEKEHVKNLKNIFLDKVELLLFRVGCGEISRIPVIRLYMAVCRLRADINRMRRFCCEAFYFMGDFAVPLLFIVLTSWTEVLPMESDLKNYPIAKVIVQLVLLKAYKKPGYNLLPLRLLLHQFYGYPKERWNCDECFQELYQNYLRSPNKSTEFALRLFCKNKDANFVLKKICEFLRPLVYKIPSENINFKATVIVLIGNICKELFKPSKDIDEKSLFEMKRWLSSLIEDGDTSDLVRQSVYLSLSKLPKKKKIKNKVNLVEQTVSGVKRKICKLKKFSNKKKKKPV